MEPQEMEDPIRQAIHECRPFLEDRKLDVEVEVGPASRPLWFERGQIDQVLINLIENACGHTPQGGQIRVRAYSWFWERRGRSDSIAGPDRRMGESRQLNAYRVDVFDSGPALPEEDMARIFDEFVSLRRDTGRPGSGLGLAICRNIVTRHQGVIWAESCPGGKQFCFALPYRAASVATAGPMQAGACLASFSNEINTL
jgi:signal transduction histidine kinase